MSVNSILTNSSALSALQSLNMTEQNLAITQNQVSTGLAVANASQNAAYWSIGQQLSSDSGIVTATNSALAQSQAVFDTATSAVNSVITTINSINTAITEATNPGADISNINISLASLSAQLNDAIAGASFNGTNVLNGSILAAMNFVSGFDASATGGAISTIGFTPQALSGVPIVPSTAQEPPITNVTTIGQLQTLALTDTSTATLAYGTDQVANSSTLADTTGDTFTVTALALDGTQTVTTYSGIDANGNATTIAAAASLDVSVTTTPPTGATSGLLDQGAYNLTSLGTGNSVQVSSTNASAMLTAVGARAGGGHQLLRPDRRHAGQNDGSGHAELRADDQLRQRRVRARRRGHERGVHSPAGSADAATARHPVLVDRQSEQPAHSEAVQRLTSTFGRAFAPETRGSRSRARRGRARDPPFSAGFG
jgi:flagellin